MNAMQRWMLKASAKEIVQLAKLAKTTRGTLRQIAGSYRTQGIPNIKAELASNIEHAAEKLRGKNPDLPVLRREHLNTACARCEFAKKCRE